MSWASSALSATISVRSCCLTGNSSLAWICRPEAGSVDRREVLQRLAQHLEQDGGRPAEQQDAVHRGHRPFQAPFLHRRDIAIAYRGVVDEGEIQPVAA